MKVYIVTNEAYPHGMAAANRITCYAKSLLSVGIDCEVVCYHRSEVFGKKIENSDAMGSFEGIPFRYVGGTTLRNKNPFVRKFLDWKDKRSTITFLKKNMRQGDVILAYVPEDKYNVILQEFAHKNRYKIIRDFCEYPYATKKVNTDTETKAKKYLSTVFKGYDGAICISQSILELSKKYNPGGKYIKVPILIDDTNWNFENIVTKYTECPYLFHSGALFQQKDGVADVLNAFADALPSLPKGTKYYFTGSIDNSADRCLIKETIEKRNLHEHVKFLGYLTKDEMMQYIKGASGFIIFKNDNLQNQYCFATKLGEYLYSGNPVITTSVGEACFYLKNKESAFIIDPKDKKALVDAIIYLINHREESKHIGTTGRQVAMSNFRPKNQGERLYNYLKEL